MAGRSRERPQMFRPMTHDIHPIDRHLRQAKPRQAQPPAIPGMAVLISVAALMLFYQLV